ncbi:polyhydroxyalkanoate depolymerase [Jannaschia sp. S6380]|uniref:polyhydroxyalkanoate depolymerase n=1 Tax=Jannaschia sp. S6380 TaxID=2926408 RepID=UPI001FF1C0C5|nr:polyhydroxyalkanoate depolymerase [Jannaschia sp. S6380]MCK0165971.1 polyhydroxyalkanoate depolymerase [Jannaschia sp. S6380]
MRYMAAYDMMEAARNTNAWLGATARTWASYPATAMVPNPMFKMLAAWGEVTERSFARMVVKPDWNIPPITAHEGHDMLVEPEVEISRPFGDLVRFSVSGRPPRTRRILLVAPMSGHYATLLRSTVASLLPDADVWITDWHNARDIPVSAGKFDVEDYTLYLADFMKHLGADLNVIAVCQPAPLTLAATALLAERDPAAQPRTLTLIGGPIDPDAAATDVTDFGRRVTMGQLEQSMIQRVGFQYPGVGRMVYPGLLQLSSFISMNAETHGRAFRDQIMAVARGAASDHDRHNRFYDEYLAVMDMTAEFYLSTVERVFKGLEIAQNRFIVDGHQVDIGKITSVAVKTVEGGKDDISAPGQCVAALDLLTGLPDAKKASYLEPEAGHYGIFAGGSWRRNIRPLVLDFIDANSDDADAAPKRRRGRRAAATPAPEALGDGRIAV